MLTMIAKAIEEKTEKVIRNVKTKMYVVSRRLQDETGEIGVIWYIGIGLIAATLLVLILSLLNPAVGNFFNTIFGKLSGL